MRSQRELWDEFNEALMDAVDVKVECEEWGLNFTSRVSADGYAECHAVDREDNNPSAAVNVMTGYYKDLGGGASMPFIRLGVEFGPYTSYYDCQTALAKKYNIKPPKSKKGMSFYAGLKEKKWSGISCIGLCKELGIKEETLKMIGGTMALTNQDDIVISMPVYDMTSFFDSPMQGYVCINAGGGKIRRYRGRGAPMELLRTQSFGRSGLLNQHAVKNWKNAQIIYKVEGITDMLTLQDKIPEKYRDTHLVVTNSDGCDSRTSPLYFADQCRGKVVVVIHDADEPGQFGSSDRRDGGATRWINSLKKRAKKCLNLMVYDDIVPKKGKDLRDWFAEGHSYEDLMAMIQAAGKEWHGDEANEKGQIIAPEEDDQNLKEHQAILKSLDIMVLGHTKNGSILVFNMAVQRKFTIPDINRFSFMNQLVHIGKAANELIADPDDPNTGEDMIDPNDVRVAIAREAGGKELSNTNTVGIGIWESGGRAIAVGAGEWIAVNGGVQTYKTPTLDDKIVDFGEQSEAWYDPDLLFPYLEAARSPAWRIETLDQLSEILGRWKNHKHPMAGTLLACLMIATWCQSLWSWRPWIAITGESGSGKTLLFNFIASYFGNICVASSDATVAGIRNTVANSSRILMLDEFEANENRPGILSMLMSANRKGMFGGSLRSNSSQGSVVSAYQLMPWFSATEMKKDKQTEANRYITFEMFETKGKYFKIPHLPEEMAILRNKSIAVALRIWQDAASKNAFIMSETAREYTRQSESYALPSSIYSSVYGHTDNQSVDFHRSMMAQLTEQTVVELEEKQQNLALNAILDSHIRLSGGRSTPVSEVLATEKAEGWSDDPEKLLRAHGIRRVPYSELVTLSCWNHGQKVAGGYLGSYVFMNVSTSGMIRKQLLRGTEYDRQDLSTILSRLPGAFRATMRTTSVGKGVMIPQSAVNGVDSLRLPTKCEMDSDLGQI